MQNQLVIWLQNEREDRGMSYRQFARFLDMSHTHVTNVLNEQNSVSWEFCEAVAKAFDMSKITTFIWGGLMTCDEAQEWAISNGHPKTNKKESR